MWELVGSECFFFVCVSSLKQVFPPAERKQWSRAEEEECYGMYTTPDNLLLRQNNVREWAEQRTKGDSVMRLLPLDAASWARLKSWEQQKLGVNPSLPPHHHLPPPLRAGVIFFFFKPFMVVVMIILAVLRGHVKNRNMS